MRAAEVILFGIQDPVTVSLIEQMGETHPVPVARTVTDDTGEFRLDAPSHGLWIIQVRAPGFIPLEMLLSPLLDSEELPATKMIRDTGLTVRVLGSSGGGVPQALVIANSQSFAQEDPWMPARRAGLTSAEGVILLPAGAKESLTISISAKDYGFLKKKEVHGPSVTFRLTSGAPSTLEVFGKDDQPVPGASVQFGSSNHPFGLTDDAGRIRLNTNPNEKIAFTVTTRDERKYSGQFQIKTDFSKPVRIILNDTSVLNGKILNRENRAPIAGALVWTTNARWNTVVSAKDGTFSLKIPYGAKYLNAAAPGFTMYQNYDLQFAEPQGIYTIVLQPEAQLLGTLLNPHNEPVSGAEVELLSRSARYRFSSVELKQKQTTGEDGTFDIVVKRTGFSEKKLEEFAIPPREPLSIILEPASNVSGIVLDSSEQPVADASVQLLKRVVRGTRTLNVFQQSESSKNDGTFEFRNISPDRYALAVSAAGWQDYEMEGVEVPQGKDVNDLRITLSPEAVLEGTVMMSDGEAAIGANVKTASEELRRYRPGVSQAWTDGSGNYVLHGLKPGKVNIDASHQEAPRQVKEIDLKPGLNRLDFQLESGYPISGRTQDESGAPVSSVRISLYYPGRSGESSATSAEDGTFLIKSVPNGEHSLEVEKEGYVTVSEDLRVQVNGAPVEGLTIALKKGSIIQGQILGLSMEKLPLVYVEGYCKTSEAYATTKVDYQGMYRLNDISAGKWEVSAGVTGGGASVSKSIVIEPGMTEAQLDLEFSKGITLDGTVLSGDSPVSNAWVRINGKETQSWASTTSGPDGSFHLEGLAKGKHRLIVSNWQEGWDHEEELDLLQDDQKITVQIPSNRVSGIVFDAQDRSLLPGVTISLLAGNTNPATRWSGGSITDSAGHFVVKNAVPGSWMLTAKKEGYAAHNQAITVEDKGEISGIEFLLQPTGGITLEIRDVLGLPKESVTIAVVNPAGQILSVGTYSSQGNGRFRISTIPSGTWELLLSDYESAQTTITVSVPQAEPVKVTLPPATKLRVKVPALLSDPAIAKMTLTGSDGRPYRSLRSWTGTIHTELEFYSGEATLETLAPGSWNIRVIVPDGRQWQKTVTTSAGKLTEAVLE